MLNIFGLLKPNNSTVSIQERHATTLAPGPRQSRAVKIVHAEGHVERYYMATTAATIIQKNPSFVLARPEIFQRPWDSVVRPEEILVPGQKYYVVSHRTVHKLMRRTLKPDMRSPSFSLIGNASQGSLSSFSGILVKPGIKIKARNLHFLFKIEIWEKGEGPNSICMGARTSINHGMKDFGLC